MESLGIFFNTAVILMKIQPSESSRTVNLAEKSKNIKGHVKATREPQVISKLLLTPVLRLQKTQN